MSPRTAALLLAAGLAMAAPVDKTVASATAENDDIALTVTLHLDPADIKQMVDSGAAVALIGGIAAFFVGKKLRGA